MSCKFEFFQKYQTIQGQTLIRATNIGNLQGWKMGKKQIAGQRKEEANTCLGMKHSNNKWLVDSPINPRV